MGRTLCWLCMFLTMGSLAQAQEYRSFFKQHCVQCHGPEKQKAKLRLDTLSAPGSDAKARRIWAAVIDNIDSGDMPPSKQPRPNPAAAKRLIDWAADALRKSTSRLPAMRRMNRVEYEHTVQDLLGIDTPLADMLPEDSAVQGFDNVAGGLGLSAILLERYLEAANVAFDGAIRRIKPLPPATRRADLMKVKDNIESVKKKKGGVISRDGAFVDFTPGWPPARIDPAHPIEGGISRCRVAVFPHDPGSKRTLSVGIFAGPLFGPGKRRFMGMFDVTGTAQKPRVIEFTTRLAEAHTLHILPWVYPNHVTWRDKDEKRPGVAVAWAETHGPLDQDFPSKAVKQLFGPSESIFMKEGWPIWMRHRKGVKLHHVDSKSPKEDAERIIRQLMPRAFRRPVDKKLADQFVKLTLDRLDQGRTFEQAVRAGVSAVLCSPHFLLLNKEAKVDDYVLASRLSYFLWSSMPDKALLDLAAQGKLRDPKVRRAQVERMCKDPKIERFIRNFTDQWLDLRQIEFTTPDKKLYPEYDELLLRSMLAETQDFFRHVLTEDLSVMQFIDSDFTFLNQRLAAHYGIPGVQGHEKMRLVKLPADSVRGGILTHASVLKVTANGTTTSPVLRGVWILEKIVGKPAPPPPAGVPAVEPDIRGATTIRQQLKKHRENETCARCHTRIDAPGFALEEFDVIGGQRTWYRSLGKKDKSVPKKSYRIGPDVERGGQLPNGRAFKDFAEYRRIMLADPETIARSLAEKLLVYGTGRPVGASDRHVVDAVVKQAAKRQYGLRAMIHAVVESELFLEP